jgi:hypothetical protein
MGLEKCGTLLSERDARGEQHATLGAVTTEKMLLPLKT